MEIEDVLRKIKSCLDLSKSSNENESAIALCSGQAAVDTFTL